MKITTSKDLVLFFHLIPLDDQREARYYNHECELSLSHGDQSFMLNHLWLDSICIIYD